MLLEAGRRRRSRAEIINIPRTFYKKVYQKLFKYRIITHGSTHAAAYFTQKLADGSKNGLLAVWITLMQCSRFFCFSNTETPHEKQHTNPPTSS